MATSTALQGYGVNLDIKNMEYMNLDDGGGQQQSGELEQQSGMQESIPDGEDIQGFGFLALIQRRPKLVGELTKLRASLVEERSKSGDMKAWKMRDLGLQATASILTAKDPLRRLLDVAQNFPTEAVTLSTLKVRLALTVGLYNYRRKNDAFCPCLPACLPACLSACRFFVLFPISRCPSNYDPKWSTT